MCRNIRTLHNFEPPATRDEVHAAAVQYVRKISGSTRPSQANQEAFDRAIAEVEHATRHLLEALTHHRAAEEPRGRGGQGAGPGGAALRAWLISTRLHDLLRRPHGRADRRRAEHRLGHPRLPRAGRAGAHADDLPGVRRERGPAARYWARAHLGWSRMGGAEPNAGHRALARLEAARAGCRS